MKVSVLSQLQKSYSLIMPGNMYAIKPQKQENIVLTISQVENTLKIYLFFVNLLALANIKRYRQIQDQAIIIVSKYIFNSGLNSRCGA